MSDLVSYSIFCTAYDNVEKIIALQPTINERASYIASEILYKEYREKFKEPLNYWKIYQKYIKYINTDEGKAKKRTLIEKLSKDISVITKKELFLDKIDINYHEKIKENENFEN